MKEQLTSIPLFKSKSLQIKIQQSNQKHQLLYKKLEKHSILSLLKKNIKE
jgi:hypothetical protein